MSDDRDDTPRGHRRPISQAPASHWDDERRATVGRPDGRRRVTTAVRGTTISGVPMVVAHSSESPVDPVEHAEADRTPVFHLLEQPLTEAGASELIAYMKRIVRKLEDASSDERRNMDELRTLMATPPPAAIAALEAQLAELRARPMAGDRLEQLVRDVAELREAVEGDGTERRPGLAATVEAHERVVAPTRKLANWALTGAAAAVLVVGGFLYRRGSEEQAVRDQLQQLERAAERCERQLDRDHRFDIPSPTPQGHAP